MSLGDTRQNNVPINDNMSHRLFLTRDSGLDRSFGLRYNDPAGIRRGLCLARQSVDGSAGVGLVGVIHVHVIHVKIAVLQDNVFSANVRVRIQVHTSVLHPRGDHNNFRHVTGNLTLEQRRISRHDVFVMYLHRILLIDN